MGRLLPFEPSLSRLGIITAAKRENAKTRRKVAAQITGVKGQSAKSRRKVAA